jgi:3-hydroxyisobutyrate dehydrogenase
MSEPTIHNAGRRVTNVAFIGLGAMGAEMAARVIAAGFAAQGFDINANALDRFEALGGQRADSPLAAALHADAVVVMVHNAVQTDLALFGPQGCVDGMAPGAVIWLASTVSPDYVKALEQRLAGKALLFVDGPVSGGVTGAHDGSLSIIAGASDTAFDRIEPVMRACASKIFRVGAAGAGATVKLINQLLTASHIALTAEAMALGMRAGIDPALLISVITDSAGTSRQFEKRAGRMASGDHTPHSTIGIFLKDIGIVLDAANKLNAFSPMAASAALVFKKAAEAGYEHASDTRLIDLYQQYEQAEVPASEGTS